MPASRKVKLPPGPLLLRTRSLLRGRPRTLTLREISDATGLPEDWLKALGRNDGPDVNRIEVLLSYLESELGARA